MGTPVGHIRNVTEEYVQSAWLLLLHCAAARANCQIRSVHPDAVERYARSHDENILQCLGRVLHIDLGLSSDEIRQTGTLLLIWPPKR